MLEAMEAAYWATATAVATNLLVPIVSIVLIMGLVWAALGIGSRK